MTGNIVIIRKDGLVTTFYRTSIYKWEKEKKKNEK
jgi:hypothetical protein